MNTKTMFKWLTFLGAIILFMAGIFLLYGPERIQFLGLPMFVLGPLIMLAVYKAALVFISKNNKGRQVEDSGVESRKLKAQKYEDSRLRWIMISSMLGLIVLFLCLTNTRSDLLGVVGGMILFFTPFTLFAIYKAARIFLNPDLPNIIAIKGLIRLTVVFLVMIFFVVLIFVATDWSVLQAGSIIYREEYRQQIQRITGGIAVFLLLGPLAVKFVVNGFKVIPKLSLHNEEIKKTKVCHVCGRVMDELDQPQKFEHKIVCDYCFKKLKT